MRTQALRQFIHSLETALPAVGVPTPQLHGLAALGRALDRFPHWELDQLADLMNRADEQHRNGHLAPTAEPSAITALRDAAGAVEQASADLRQGRDAPGLEAARNELRSALEALAKRYGEKVSFKTDANWLVGLKDDAAIANLTSRIEALVPRITSSDAYSEAEIKSEIDALVGDKKLIGRAAERLGGPSSGTPRSLVLAVLAQRSGYPFVEPEKAKKEGGGKAKKPKPGDAEVVEKIASLRALVAKAANPAAVDRSEVVAAVDALGTEGFSLPQIKEIALAVANEKAKNKDLAFAALRETLLGARRILDSQEQ